MKVLVIALAKYAWSACVLRSIHSLILRLVHSPTDKPECRCAQPTAKGARSGSASGLAAALPAAKPAAAAAGALRVRLSTARSMEVDNGGGYGGLMAGTQLSLSAELAATAARNGAHLPSRIQPSLIYL